MTRSTLRSVTAANQVALAAFGLSTRADNGTEKRDVSSIPSLAYESGDWSFDRTVEDRDDITVGDRVRFSKRIDEDDVQKFAQVSGDTNRLHLDDEFAEGTRFGGRIAHGTLVSGMISAALARLPGLTIYHSQNLEFRRPVSIGDRISAVVEVVEDLGDNKHRLSTEIFDENRKRTIVDGEAVVLVDELPREE